MWSWLLTCIKYQSVEGAECYLHSSLCTIITWCLDIGTLFTYTFTSILQDHKRPENNRVGRMLSWNAEPYHAGLSAARRKQVQKAFMSGKSWTFNCFTSIDFAAGLTPRAAIFFKYASALQCFEEGDIKWSVCVHRTMKDSYLRCVVTDEVYSERETLCCPIAGYCPALAGYGSLNHPWIREPIS